MAKRGRPPKNPPSTNGDGSIYEVWLDEDCPRGCVNVLCVNGIDSHHHRAKRFFIDVPKETLVYQLVCSDPECGQRWEPEQPLRPGGVLRMPENAKWRERFQKSYLCPKCGTKGRQIKVQENEIAPHRRTRKRWYLTPDEYEFFQKRIDPERKRVRKIVDRKMDTGEVIPTTAGWESRPLEHKMIDRGGVVQSTLLGPFVNIRKVDDIQVEISQRDFEQLEKKAKEQAELIRLIGEQLDEREQAEKAGNKEAIEEIDAIIKALRADKANAEEATRI